MTMDDYGAGYHENQTTSGVDEGSHSVRTSSLAVLCGRT